MDGHFREFWRRLQTGVEVAVAGSSPDRLLGVRDGFRHYFHEGLQRSTSVVVVPQEVAESATGLLMSDEEIVGRARERAGELAERLGDSYHFFVASEGGIAPLQVDGEESYFVRNWSCVMGPFGEALGSSSSLQLPDRTVERLDRGEASFWVPGRRKEGGILAAVTGGLETRRGAISASTTNALASLFYGILQSDPRRA